ncbi:MAG TPA: HlyD family efflux transporter periplasmic adaptor subunit [Nitrospirae bacterium]|nr:HlyD family efflux transporter periplasmic adaptor subunit [Nitrospirota bacterium]
MKKRLLIAGLVIAVTAAVLFLAVQPRHEAGEDVIIASGNVEVTEVDMGFKHPGRVTELYTDEGRRVKKGQILAVLDKAELESMVQERKARLNEAVVKLQELRAGSRPQQIEKARADVGYAEAVFSNAKNDYERDRFLFENGAISARQMDASEKAYQVSLSRYRHAKEALSLVQEGPRKEELKAQQMRVQQAEAALRASEERLKETMIYAPVSGVILRKYVEAGETVAGGMPVYTIGDLKNPWIKVYIKEDRLGLVKLGQKAMVTTDSYPGKIYEGAITRISSKAEFTPKNVQTEEERVKLVFGVEISVNNEKDELKPGMPADVRILLE